MSVGKSVQCAQFIIYAHFANVGSLENYRHLLFSTGRLNKVTIHFHNTKATQKYIFNHVLLGTYIYMTPGAPVNKGLANKEHKESKRGERGEGGDE